MQISICTLGHLRARCGAFLPLRVEARRGAGLRSIDGAGPASAMTASTGCPPSSRKPG